MSVSGKSANYTVLLMIAVILSLLLLAGMFGNSPADTSAAKPDESIETARKIVEYHL